MFIQSRPIKAKQMNTMKSIAAAVILFALSSIASADVIPVYSQNFDSMGTGTTAPSGWFVYSIAGSHDQFTPPDDTTNTGVLPTGPAISGGSLSSPLVVATAGTSTSQKGTQGYNWAVNGSTTNRSLGTSPSGVAGMVLQAVIPNNTGAAITSLNIDYDTLVQSVTTDNNNYTANNYVGIEESARLLALLQPRQWRHVHKHFLFERQRAHLGQRHRHGP